jgi:plastocyanin
MASRFARFVLMLGVIATFGVALVACGGGEEDAGAGEFSTAVAAQQVVVVADPSGALRWDKASYEATAGDITFVVQNPSPVVHQFSVEGNGVSYKSPNIKSKATASYTVANLPPGEYQIVCNFPGHKAAGMVAKLTVR